LEILQQVPTFDLALVYEDGTVDLDGTDREQGEPIAIVSTTNVPFDDELEIQALTDADLEELAHDGVLLYHGPIEFVKLGLVELMDTREAIREAPTEFAQKPSFEPYEGEKDLLEADTEEVEAGNSCSYVSNRFRIHTNSVCFRR
jgi:hypothetical protein